MKFRTLRSGCAAVIRVGLAATFCCGGALAANLLTATPATVALTCNTLTGPGPAALIVVKPAAKLNGTIAVVLGASSGLIVTPPSPALLNAANQAQGLTFAVSLGAGCAGVNSGAATLRFFANSVADLPVPASIAVTASASALVASAVELTCAKSAGTPVVYTPGAAQTALLSSAAAGGTPFTVDASTIPAWLVLPPTTATSAGAKGVVLVMSPAAPCGNFAAGIRTSVNIHLKNPPAPDGLIPVTLQIVGPPPVIASPAAPSLSYVKGSGTPAFVDVALSTASSAALSFTVDSASLPSWLAVDSMSGSVPRTLRFTTTPVADASAQGLYTATVRMLVPGYGDMVLPVRLTVSNPPPKLTVAEGTARNLSWTVGQLAPTLYVTLASSDSPIPYAISTGGALAPIVGGAFLKGIAYNYATPVPVTFDAGVLQAAQVGSVLSGTVAITWGSPEATTVVTINLTPQPAGAALLAVNPPSLPTAAPGHTFVVALTGIGFVASADATQATTVGIVSGGMLTSDASIAATVLNSSNIIVAITVSAGANSLPPFAVTGSGGTISLGVCNPRGAACTVPTGTVKLIVTPNPVIQAVTSAASFLQVAAPALPVVAPYDMISLFGASFCVSGGTGCMESQVLYGTPDASTLRYPMALSPDAANGAQRLLTVVFQTHTTPPVIIASAPLLFATNGQINLLVPSAVALYVGRTIDVAVNFGMLSSAPFPVRVAAADPAIFTIGSNGQGDGAILGLDWSIIGSGNPAALRASAADSDSVQIYMTGLGAPDGAANNSTAGAGKWPADCVTPTSYLAALNLQTGSALTTMDGVLIAGTLLNANRLPPCLSSAAAVPTVTIGGQPAEVTYAGWVTDSVAGQYQVNVRLPGNAAGVFVDAGSVNRGATHGGGATSGGGHGARNREPGGRHDLGRAALESRGAGEPAGCGGSGMVWRRASGERRDAAYRYAITQGSLPAGLTLDAASGAIAGTPMAAARGPYTVTVTATDSAANPLTGNVTFTLIVR